MAIPDDKKLQDMFKTVLSLIPSADRYQVLDTKTNETRPHHPGDGLLAPHDAVHWAEWNLPYWHKDGTQVKVTLSLNRGTGGIDVFLSPAMPIWLPYQCAGVHGQFSPGLGDAPYQGVETEVHLGRALAQLMDYIRDALDMLVSDWGAS